MTWQGAQGPPVTAVSRSDALTLWAMLAHGEETENDRLRLSGLSRTSYHRSRRKAYDLRWLEDRYVPDPRCLGYSLVAVGLSRPLADHAASYLNAVATFPGNVLLWTLSGYALGVFFLRDARDRAALSKLWEAPGQARDSDLVVCEPTAGNVPVYFDPEGLWTHILEMEGTVRYPRGLVGRSEPTPGDGRVRSGVAQMMRGVSGTVAGSGPIYLHRSLGLRRSQRRLVERGYVARRVFLGSRAIPSFGEREVNRLLCVTGRTDPGFQPSSAVGLLTQKVGVFPYLVAGGGGKLTLGFLGQSSPPITGKRPPSSFVSQLLPTLATFLNDINTFQGDLGTLVPMVDHRYDRLSAH